MYSDAQKCNQNVLNMFLCNFFPTQLLLQREKLIYVNYNYFIQNVVAICQFRNHPFQ